ncbi:hypothetical protein BT63DRAFT_480959 [Microthyrium microscopicum]|uniref:Uncharacterized protein n=1 Tax=Microthyrium microscopicum TaxID=703497 RepID=A0A6A6U755_9PEZI|nr:hypothetical protein BT63DRAFT_480959 [Microthyrium microscopicum]
MDMDGFTFYSLATSGWLAIQALPLLFTPTVLLPLFTHHEDATSDLSLYLARALALSLLSLSVTALFLSGVLPVNTRTETPVNPYASPITIITTMFHFGSAFLAYTAYADSRGTMFMLGLIGSGNLFALGMWAVMFGGDVGHISKRTGKDKRTSKFPFGDKKGRAEGLKET